MIVKEYLLELRDADKYFDFEPISKTRNNFLTANANQSVWRCSPDLAVYNLLHD